MSLPLSTPAEEQKRIESRQREQLRREVQRVASQGRSLLLTQSHHTKNKWWQGAHWERLHVKLPVWLVERLEVFRTVLQTLSDTLAAATKNWKPSRLICAPRDLAG